MSFERFLKDNLIKRVKPDFKQIGAQLRRAEKDLKTGKSLVSNDPTWAYAIIYHAMIRAGRALLFSHGYLPTSQRSHKTIIEGARLILGDEYHDLLSRFNRMRRKRHDFIYDSVNDITPPEVKSALETATNLIKKIRSIFEQAQTQKELF